MARELTEQEWKDLLYAVRHNEADKVKDMIKDVDVNSLNTHQFTGRGITLLYEAVNNGNEETIEVLLAKGVDVNAPTKMGGRPFDVLPSVRFDSPPQQFALRNRVARRLLEAGAEDRTGVYTDKTILMDAIQEQDVEKVKQLISEGTDVDAKDKDGTPVWEYALLANNAEIMNILVDAKMNLEQYNKDGKTALMEALTSLPPRSKDIMSLMIEKGDVNAKSIGKLSQDKTPLFFTQDENFVRALIAKGANVHATDAKGETAIWDKPVACLEVLRDGGADLTATDEHGMTLISDAAFQNDMERVKFLQECGFDINAPDKAGMTPMMRAVIDKETALLEQGLVRRKKLSVEFVQQMIDAGAKVFGTDPKGRTTIELVGEKCPDVKELLLQRYQKEEQELKGEIKAQTEVSHAVGNKKIAEARKYQKPQEKESNEVAGNVQSNVFVRHDEGRA